MEKNKVFAIVFLSLAIFIASYSWLDGLLVDFLADDSEFVTIERVIDGDTVVAKDGRKIRMLGINTPEKGEAYSSESQNNLEKMVLNKTVKIEYGKDKTDLYGRTLAYLFAGRINVNKMQVESGLANYYFPSGKDEHYNEFKGAWISCVEEGRGICESSGDICASCIAIKEFDHWDEEVIFENFCSRDCDLTGWEIKDEGRKKFIFPAFVLSGNSEFMFKVVKDESLKDSGNEIFWKRKDYVWTASGDTLFLRDAKGKLVLWQGY